MKAAAARLRKRVRRVNFADVYRQQLLDLPGVLFFPFHPEVREATAWSEKPDEDLVNDILRSAEDLQVAIQEFADVTRRECADRAKEHGIDLEYAGGGRAAGSGSTAGNEEGKGNTHPDSGEVRGADSTAGVA